jgi:hypothetical protein
VPATVGLSIGSSNLDRWSSGNLEANQEIQDASFAADAAPCSESDCAQSAELDHHPGCAADDLQPLVGARRRRLDRALESWASPRALLLTLPGHFARFRRPPQRWKRPLSIAHWQTTVFHLRGTDTHDLPPRIAVFLAAAVIAVPGCSSASG